MSAHTTAAGFVPAARLLTIGGLMLSGLSGAAVAEEPASDWEIRLGAGAMYKPDYEGSDDYEVSPLPMFAVGYKDLIFLEGPKLGANLLNVEGPGPGDYLRAGPLLNYRFGRDQGDNDALRGLGDVDGSVEAGAFVEYGIRGFTVGATALQDVSDGHGGLTVEFQGGYSHQFDEHWFVQAGVSATWADDDYVQSYFGINASQALRSGYRQYSPEAGFKDVGLSAALGYALTENWSVTGRVGYSRLLGDAADSPIVDQEGSANAYEAGVFVGYRF